jgi:hypothetical protein
LVATRYVSVRRTLPSWASLTNWVTPPKTTGSPSGPTTRCGYQRPYFIGAAAWNRLVAGSNRLALRSLPPAMRIFPLGRVVRSEQNRSPGGREMSNRGVPVVRSRRRARSVLDVGASATALGSSEFSWPSRPLK